MGAEPALAVDANDLITRGFTDGIDSLAPAAGLDDAKIRKGITELDALNTPTKWLTSP